MCSRILKSSTSITVVNGIGISYVLSVKDDMENFMKASKMVDEIDSEDEVEGVAKSIIDMVCNKQKAEEQQSIAETSGKLSVGYMKKLGSFFGSMGIEITMNEHSGKEDITIYGEYLDENQEGLYGLIYGMANHEDSSFDSKRKFLDKLMNSHFDVEQIDQICNFMLRGKSGDLNKYEINEEGNFLLYRAANIVSEHHISVDYHTGKIPQIVGATYRMGLCSIDKNPNNTCSHGLHVATKAYAEGFLRSGGAIFLVEVDPRNIVSVPTDYNFMKVRCSEYKIIKVLPDDQYNTPEVCDDVEIILHTYLEDAACQKLEDDFEDVFDFQLSDIDPIHDEEIVFNVGRNGSIKSVTFRGTDIDGDETFLEVSNNV